MGLLALWFLLVLGGYVAGLIATFGGGEPAGGFALLGAGVLVGLFFWSQARQDIPRKDSKRVPATESNDG